MRKCSKSTIWPSAFANERTDRGRTQQPALHMSSEQAAANAHRCGGALGFCTLSAPLPVWRARAMNKTTKLRAGRRISRTNHMRAGSPPGEQAGAAMDCAMPGPSTVFPCCPGPSLPHPSHESGQFRTCCFKFKFKFRIFRDKNVDRERIYPGPRPALGRLSVCQNRAEGRARTWCLRR